MRMRQTHQNAIGDDVRVFLDHYLDLLGTRFMNDQELGELCQRIYKNHRQALDLIWEHAGSPQSELLVEVANLLEQDTRWHVLYRSSRYVDFVPKTWPGWLPPFNPDESYPFCIHIWSDDRCLGYTLFVGPMQGVAGRREIITKLREESPGCGFKRSKARQVEGEWNRISSDERILEWSRDDEPDPEAIRVAVKKTLDELYPKLEKLALVLKPLCNPPASA